MRCRGPSSSSRPVDAFRGKPYTRTFRARSSAGEHTLHTGGVVGSIPTAPTTFCPWIRMNPALSLRPGDRVPDFILPGLDGKLRKFIWSFTGKPVALVVVDDLKTIDPEQFGNLARACAEAHVEIVVAAGSPPAATAAAWSKLDRGVLLADGERKFVPLLLAQGGGVAFGQSGVGLRQRVIVLDANQRVAGTF